MRQTVQEKEKDLPPLKQTMVAAPEVMVEKPVVVERKMEEEKKVMESRRGLNWWREKEDYNNKRIWPTTVATKVNFQRGGILTDWLLATTYQRTWVASAKAIWMTHQWGRVLIHCDPLQSIQRRKSIQYLDIWEVLWIQDSSCSMTWVKLKLAVFHLVEESVAPFVANSSLSLWIPFSSSRISCIFLSNLSVIS